MKGISTVLLYAWFIICTEPTWFTRFDKSIFASAIKRELVTLINVDEQVNGAIRNKLLQLKSPPQAISPSCTRIHRREAEN